MGSATAAAGAAAAGAWRQLAASGPAAGVPPRIPLDRMHLVGKRTIPCPRTHAAGTGARGSTAARTTAAASSSSRRAGERCIGVNASGLLTSGQTMNERSMARSGHRLYHHRRTAVSLTVLQQRGVVVPALPQQGARHGRAGALAEAAAGRMPAAGWILGHWVHIAAGCRAGLAGARCALFT